MSGLLRTYEEDGALIQRLTGRQATTDMFGVAGGELVLVALANCVVNNGYF